MKVALLNIGNELLAGFTINTNAAWMGQTLIDIGLQVTKTVVIGDSRTEIEETLGNLWDAQDVILVTGGLGPTHDDITVAAVAKFFESDLTFHEPTFQALSDRLESRDIPVTEQHRQQAMLPADAEIILNHAGTAPALYFQQDGKHVFCLPGVPHEMKHLMTHEILPRLQQLHPDKNRRFILRTIGYPESQLYQEVKDIIAHLPEDSVAFLPQIYGVDIRFLVHQNESVVSAAIEEIKVLLGNAIFAESKKSMSAVVGELLRNRNLTLATAESCTGGLLADEITNVPGSSDYFLQGKVTYSNQAKISELGVDATLIKKHGAVSSQVARAMVLGAQKASDAYAALSTTGIAGPTGGTDDKPVGLVYIGCITGNEITVKRYKFSDDRRLNKERSVMAAMNMLRLQLLTGD